MDEKLETEVENETVVEGSLNIYDRYQIVTTLGEGGQGEVYAAVDKENGLLAALKITSLIRAESWGGVERLRNEAEAGKRLDHESIPQIYEYSEGRDPVKGKGEFYLVSEYIEGENLQKQLGNKFAEEELLNIIQQALDGLGHAHSTDDGIVHRDIKPNNLIYADGKLHILDFGSYKDMGKETRMTTLGVAGTYGYLSPEQAGKFAKVGPMSDIYSLGLTVLDLARGKTRTDQQIQGDPIELVRNLDYSDQFKELLEDMLKYNPTDRAEKWKLEDGFYPDLEEKFYVKEEPVSIIEENFSTTSNDSKRTPINLKHLGFASICTGGFIGYMHAQGIPISPEILETAFTYGPTTTFGLIGGKHGVEFGLEKLAAREGPVRGAILGAYLSGGIFAIAGALFTGIGYAVGYAGGVITG